jgi:glycosyltransferase involved in cell wall biosynthesis
MSRHILIYEPKIEGHHLTWLRYICEDFLSLGHKLTVAVDPSPSAASRIEAKLGPLLSRIERIDAAPDGKRNAPLHLARMATLLRQSGADGIFMPCLDEVSSWMLRRAFWGGRPPEILKGRLSGIFLRPRFLVSPFWPLKETLKTLGFRRLLKEGWFHRLLLLDEQFLEAGKDSRFGFIPEPFSGEFPHTKEAAREKLGIPSGRTVLLHYGIASRRKGLHLTVRALLSLPSGQRPFLLCAGPQLQDAEIHRGLVELEASGDALILDRYILEEEETLCFCACDIVLLTYIAHFGSSAVLSRAAAAGRMVIASDEELTGRRVRDHELGWLFPSGESDRLAALFLRAARLTPAELASFEAAGRRYMETFSRDRFRAELAKSAEGGAFVSRPVRSE